MIRFWKFRLLVEKTKNAVAFRLDQIDAVLIIDKGNLFDSQSLFFVQILFIFENTLIEKLLKLLVAVVDAELLEAVEDVLLDRRDDSTERLLNLAAGIKGPGMQKEEKEKHLRLHLKHFALATSTGRIAIDRIPTKIKQMT